MGWVHLKVRWDTDVFFRQLQGVDHGESPNNAGSKYQQMVYAGLKVLELSRRWSKQLQSWCLQNNPNKGLLLWSLVGSCKMISGIHYFVIYFCGWKLGFEKLYLISLHRNNQKGLLEEQISKYSPPPSLILECSAIHTQGMLCPAKLIIVK